METPKNQKRHIARSATDEKKEERKWKKEEADMADPEKAENQRKRDRERAKIRRKQKPEIGEAIEEEIEARDHC